MKIDPRDLQMLAAIVDQGGLTQAAEAMGRAQPSLSRSLSLLEKRIGSRLFEIGKRPLRPTELCLDLAGRGRVITGATEQASSAATRYSSGKSGVARVGGTPIFMDGVISRMIAQFQNAYPDVQIKQSYAYLHELTEQLSVGNIDLAICPVDHDQVAPPLAFEPILTGRNVIACSPEHPLARKLSLKLEDIAPYSWVAPPASSPLYEDLRATLNSIGITDFKVGFSGGSLSSIVTIVQGSRSLTVLPYSVVYMQRQHRTLTALPIEIHHPRRQLGLLWRSDRPTRPAIQRFRQFIQVSFQDLERSIARQGRDALWRR